ncbi:MAG: cupin domain-containing protein [Gammaproteobacteria bacterium]|nr:cupin domain-containing protein [Gammaproteobacteria bacterium]
MAADSENRMTISNALAALAEETAAFKKIFAHGTLEIEIYQPRQVDEQEPHSRDEVYVVATGTGFFINGGSRQPVEPGEVLFVRAGIEHRFVDFTPDFSTWVIFYGPEGGE